MPRQRTIKPEFFRDKTMARLGSQVALVYEALWCWADDGGVARIDPDLLKGEAFARWPDFTQGVITECLVSLHGARRIAPYAIGDELYAEVATLGKHSPPNHPSKFRYPRGGQAVDDIRGWISGQLTHGGLREPSSSTSSTTSTSTSKAAATREAWDFPVEPERRLSAPSAYAIACVKVVNGILDQRLAGAFRPLVASIEEPTADEWVALGIPLEIAVATLGDRTRSFAPKPHNQQPRSLAYFTDAVREAFERTRSAAPAVNPFDELLKREQSKEAVA